MQRLVDLLNAISIWVVIVVGRGVEDLQAAAVRMTRRAQWFLINLPMVAIKAIKRKDTSSRPSPRRRERKIKRERRR